MIASYSFNGAGTPPDPPWTAQGGALTEAGGYLVGVGVGYNVSTWNPFTPGPAQFAEFTIGASLSGFQNLILRCASPTDYIFIYSSGAGTVSIEENVSSSHNTIASGALAYGAGDVVRVEIDAANMMSFYLNGVFAFDFDYSAIPPVLLSGAVGVGEYASSMGIASWRGGDLAAAAADGIFPVGGL